MRLQYKRLLVAGVTVATASTHQSDAIAQVGNSYSVRVAAVGDYSYYRTTHTTALASDIPCNDEGNGFWNGLVRGAGPFHYTPGNLNIDNSVRDVDFYDPNLTLSSNDADSNYVDAPGSAVTYACTHGIYAADILTTPCTSDANCPAGSYCTGGSTPPAGASHACITQKTKTMLTSSTLSLRGNKVPYGKNSGAAASKSMAFGEDANATWAAVGTNGGTNVLFLIDSQGFRSRFLYDDTTYLFSGVHAILGTMSTGAIVTSSGLISFSDTVSFSSRGTNVANLINANFASNFLTVWGDPTVIAFGSVNAPGGAAVADDGLNFVMAKGASASSAQWHALSESWHDAQAEINDGDGLGYWSWYVVCTYNCATLGV